MVRVRDGAVEWVNVTRGAQVGEMVEVYGALTGGRYDRAARQRRDCARAAALLFNKKNARYARVDQDHIFGFTTRALHAGQRPDSETGARAVPIYQTTSYVFEDTEHAAESLQPAALRQHLHPHHEPHHRRLRRAHGVARARRGRAGGRERAGGAVHRHHQPARPGDEIVAASTLYGGTYTQFDVSFRRFGIDTTFVDPDDPENFRRAITPRTRLLYGETIGNPRINVLDIAAVAEIAHEANMPLMIDNTFASPYLCRPIEHGADIVVHSATKFIGGHGTSIGGVIVDSGTLSLGPRRVPAAARAEQGLPRHPFLRDVRRFRLHHEGARGRPARFRAGAEPVQLVPVPPGSRNAEAAHGMPLAATRWRWREFLAGHPRVAWVNYPGLPSSPYHALAQKYLPQGRGAIMTLRHQGRAWRPARASSNRCNCSRIWPTSATPRAW